MICPIKNDETYNILVRLHGERVAAMMHRSVQEDFLKIFQGKQSLPLTEAMSRVIMYSKNDLLISTAKAIKDSVNYSKYLSSVSLELQNESGKDILISVKKPTGEIYYVAKDKFDPKILKEGDVTGTATSFGSYSDVLDKIRIFPSAVPRESLYHLITHEALHALTVKSMKNDKAIADEAEELRLHVIEELKKRNDNTYHYGLTDKFEFVVEAFTNKKFYETLVGVPSKKVSKTTFKTNVWLDFIKLVYKTLAIKSRTLLQDIAAIIEKSVLILDTAKKTNSVVQMVEADYFLTKDVEERLEDYKKVFSTLYKKYNQPSPQLFAEIIANEGYQLPDVPTNIKRALTSTLRQLSSVTGIPFEVINDKEQKFKGAFVSAPQGKKVVINVAYASDDTPFHEFFHPFVRSIKDSPLYDQIVQEARLAGEKDIDSEEAVTLYLGKVASRMRPTTGLKLFLNFIKSLFYKAFGINSEFYPSTTVREVVDKLLIGDANFDVEDNMIAFQEYNEREGLRNNKADTSISTIEILENIDKGLTTDDLSKYYTSKDGEEFKRATVFVSGDEDGEFSHSYKGKFIPRSDYAALQDFSRAGLNPETDTIKVNNVDLTFEQLTLEYKKTYSKQSKFGKAVHAYLEFVATSDKIQKAKAREAFTSYASEYAGASVDSPKDHPDFYFLEDEAETILTDYAGINTSSIKALANPKYDDKLAAEITLSSNILVDKDGKKLATTADLLVEHYGGELSLIDYKTGDIFRDHNTTTKFLQYGDDFEVKDSRADRASLELVLRAIMIKEANPSAKFRAIKIVKVSKNGSHYTHTVDPSKYLSTIGAYYKANHPEVYTKLQEQGLLESSTYLGISSSIATSSELASISTMNVNQQKEWIEARLSAIRFSPAYQNGELPPELKKRYETLTRLYLEITKSPLANLDSESSDLSRFSRSFKNISETDSPLVQTLASNINRAKLEENNEKAEILTKFNSLMNNYHLSQGVEPSRLKKIRAFANTAAGTAIVGGMITGTLPFVGVGLAASLITRRFLAKPSKEYYAFMWRKYSTKGKQGYFLNTLDTYQDINGNEVPLSKEQKELRDFFSATNQKLYMDVMSKPAFYSKFGKPISMSAALGMPDSLPSDFMPRVPQDIEEIRENEKFTEGYLGVKSRTQYWIKRNLTDFIERNYWGSKSLGVRVKYFAHYGDDIVDAENHSFDIEKIFRLSIGNMVHKKHFDKIYNLAEGTSSLLESARDSDGKKKYPEYVSFLSDQIHNNILNEDRPIKFAILKPVKIKGKLAQALGVRDGAYSLNQDAIARSLKASVSLGALGFKLLSASFNAANLAIANTMYPLTGSFSRVLGVPPEDVRFGTLTENPLISAGKGGGKALADLTGYFKSYLTGDVNNNKLFLIAKKFDWLSDNFDYESTKEDMTRDLTRPGINNMAFAMQGLTESNGALYQLSSILNSIYITNTDGEKMTIMDAYDVENGNLVWKGGVRGNKIEDAGTLSELSELDSREIKALRRIYERAQGGYRADEKSAIEATILGEFVTQFKKFFFTYLKTNYQSTFTDDSFGTYVLQKGIQRPDGVPVYQWEAQVMSGRVRVLADALLLSLQGVHNKEARERLTYLWTTPYEQLSAKDKSYRIRSAELLSTATLFIAVFALYSAAFGDDDDDDTYQAKRLWKLVEDTSFGILPTDIISTAEKPIIFLDKALKFGKGMSQVLTLQRTKDGRLKGVSDVNQIIPGASNPRQIHQFLTNKKYNEDKLFGIAPSISRDR